MLFGEIESVVTTRTGKEKNIENDHRKLRISQRTMQKNGNCINKKKAQLERQVSNTHIRYFLYIPAHERNS